MTKSWRNIVHTSIIKLSMFGHSYNSVSVFQFNIHNHKHIKPYKCMRVLGDSSKLLNMMGQRNPLFLVYLEVTLTNKNPDYIFILTYCLFLNTIFVFRLKLYKDNLQCQRQAWGENNIKPKTYKTKTKQNIQSKWLTQG